MKGSTESMKALLIGSYFMEELADHLNYFETKAKIVNQSPMSNDLLCTLENMEGDFDCVLVDLMVCAAWLFEQSGKIRTLDNGKNAEHVYDPATFKCTQFDKNYDMFINYLIEHYSADKLFVVAASLPPYFVTQFQLRRISNAEYITEWKQSFKYVKRREERFITKTNAKVISLSQYYFIKKPIGYSVSFVRYEELLYKDINQWFYDNRTGVMRDDALFKFKLDRYIMYQYKTIHYKAFYRFLNDEDIVDKLLLSAPRQYVIDNYENLIRFDILRKGRKKQPEYEDLYDIVQKDTVLTEEFKRVITALLILQKGTIFENPPEVFKEMFRNSIVPNDVKKEVRNYWRVHGINPRKITNHNVGYYYIKMRGGGIKEAKQFIADNTVTEPILVDVYGSCISYQTINEFISGATEVVHNNYYVHVPIYESSELPVEHPEVVWQGEPANECEKNVRIQFEHQIEEDLKKSEAKWCLIDLYSLITPCTYLYKNFCFTDYGNKTWQKFAAQKMNPGNGYYQKLIQTDDFLEKIHKWANWIKAKYGNNIILVNFKVSQYKIGDDNRLYYAYKNVEQKNSMIEKVYCMVKGWLDCYCIEFGKEFLADDIGYNSSTSVHYELNFYEAEAAVIQHIIATNPEQKIYEAYSNEVRVNRILRLARYNESGLLGQVFRKNLDRIILSLPVEIIEQYKKEIIQFYDIRIDSRVDMLKEISLLEAKDPLYYYELKKRVFEIQELNTLEVKEVKRNYDRITEMAIYNKYANKLMENTSYTIEFYDGDIFLFEQKVVYGVNTRLLLISEDERIFVGWKAYRMSDGKVTCIKKDGKKEFIDEKKINEDNNLYLFSNGAKIGGKNSKVDGDIIKMYAIWQNKKE